MFETLKIGVQLTESCDLACGHCATNSSPRVKSTLDRAHLWGLLEQIREIDPEAEVGFTGGEVFYVRDLLYEAIDFTRKLGIAYSITTNGSWAVDPAERTAVLKSILDCRKIGLSSDIYHSNWVDKRVIGLAMQEALSLGIESVIRYTYVKGETPDEIYDALGIYDPALQTRVHFNGVMAIGRARRRQLVDQDVFPEHADREPCLAASVVTVKSTGAVYACCGESLYIPGEHALKLGQLPEDRLAAILAERERNVVVQAIRTVGARRLAREAGVIGSGRFDQALAKSPCGSCRLCLQDEDSRGATERAAVKLIPHVAALRALYYGEV